MLYAKPFGQNNGLGALPSKYRKGFPSVEMEESHHDLLHCRDKIYAHRDIEGANYTARGDFVPNLHTSRIEIRPSVDRKPRRISTCPSLPDIAASSIPEIVSLLDFQLARISCTVGKLLTDLKGRRTYPPGIYTVGVDFP